MRRIERDPSELSGEQAAWVAPVARRFSAGFPRRRDGLRTIGREAEYPVVDPQGAPGAVGALFAAMAQAGDLDVQWEGELMVGLRAERYEYTIEVGRGTIEVITAPCEDLCELEALHEQAMAPVLEAAAQTGLALLGYGVQPLARVSRELMTPKQRYGALLEVLGERWLWFAVTASDQIQIDVDRPELVALTNACNLLTPVVVALCANSPVQGGYDRRVASTREARMGEIHVGGFRHGMPSVPVADVVEHITRLGRLPMLVAREVEQLRPVGRRFDRWIEGSGLQGEALYEAFLLHEHYVWHSARPRSAHGTLELRAACQQPWEEHMAAAALSLGLVECAVDLERWLRAELGDATWPAMSQWHRDVVQGGLAAPPPVSGLLERTVEACTQALRARGRGEERYAEALQRRLRDRENPAMRTRRIFGEGGIDSLLALSRIR